MIRTLCFSAALALLVAACDRPTTGTSAPGSAASKPTNPATTADTTSPNRPATASLSGAPGEAAKPVKDPVVTGKVKAALAGDTAMKDTDISVSTEGGVVRLKGTAASAEQVALAGQVAQRQQGVRRIENDIEVK